MGLVDRLKRARKADPTDRFGLSGAEFKWVLDLDALVYELAENADLDDQTYDLLTGGCERVPVGLHELSEPDLTSARTAAAIGYFARTAEATRHPTARQFEDHEDAERFFQYVDEARHGNGAAKRESVQPVADDGLVASVLATREALDPSPDDRFRPSRCLPGMPVDQRSHLRDRTLLNCVRPGPNETLVSPSGQLSQLSLDDLRRLWKFGYLLRALQDLEPSDAASGRS